MLSRLLGLFRRKISESSATVANRERIIALLSDLADHRARVAIRVLGNDLWYQSMVLEIDIQGNRLVLDHIHDELGHRRLLRARRFQAEARLLGVAVAFNGELAPGDGEDGAYHVTLPSTVEHRERRKSYRVEIPGDRAVPVSLIGMGSSLRGHLQDISVTGLSIRTRDTVLFHVGDEVTSCSFTLPGGVSISCRLRIISLRLDSTTHQTRVGGEMLDLSEKQRRGLDRTLAQMQRQRRH